MNYIQQYKEGIFVWSLINLPELYWKFLWLIWPDYVFNLDVFYIGHGHIDYKIRWAFYYGICYEYDTRILILNVKYLRSLLNRAIVGSSYCLEECIEFSYTNQNISKKIIIDIKRNKYMYEQANYIHNEWASILFGRIKL
jgi:hypothetical protein